MNKSGIKRIVTKLIPDKIYLKHRFRSIMGYPLNLNNPVTYNEKLQWLKLNDRKNNYSKLVDKYEVKKFVANKIGKEYIIPTYGVWNRFDEIDFDKLPNQFVLKCTHDSGSYVICSDKEKFDVEAAKLKIEKALKSSFYWDSREWPYKNVRPRIIAEKYIGFYPKDYKFFVFDSEIDSVMVCNGRENGHPKFYFYDTDWKRLYYQHKEIEFEDTIEKPLGFETMIEIVKQLSEGFPHIRIDLYNVNGKIWFGEYTFYDQGGFDTDITRETDLLWGKKIKLQMNQ